MEQEGECALDSEIPEQDQVQKITFTIRRCGLCREPGHDKRICPQQPYSTTEAHLVEWRVFLSELHYKNLRRMASI